MRTRSAFLVVAAHVALTVATTWPLLLPGRDRLPDADDAYFSTWRLAWVAHQLPRDAAHLFDTNVFHPAANTLALSDAMLLVSVIGAPLIWIGIPASIVHNLLLGAAMVTSMWCMFLLARHLTHSTAAAWIASIIFGLAPYRVAHIGHLELQWVMWMPLAVWLLHRFSERPSWGRAVAVGVAVMGQAFCSIYYGVFLAAYLAALSLIALIAGTVQRSAIKFAFAAIAPLFLVALIYGPPYAAIRSQQGPRGTSEVHTYSATLSDYLRVPSGNRLRGHADAGDVAPEERSLYPGTAALILAAIALVRRPTRTTVLYAALTAIAIDLSLGTNGLLFPLGQRVVPILTSLRSPARFGVLVLLSVSMLAAFGVSVVVRARPRWTVAVTAVVTGLCLAEYWSAPLMTRPGQSVPTEAHVAVSHQPPGTVILEMPVPRPDMLWLNETTYQLRSIHHWQQLVNGYSGSAPAAYLETLHRLRGFPDEVSIARLRELGVRFVLLNRVYYDGDEFTRLIGSLAESPAFWPAQAYGAGENQIVVVELRRAKR